MVLPATLVDSLAFPAGIGCLAGLALENVLTFAVVTHARKAAGRLFAA